MILLGVLLAVGVATAIVTVGFVLLGITMMIWRFGADLERERAALVLGHPIARPQRATAARLRRIERDLHDGAQHRLADIGMELGRARAKLASDPDAVDRLLADAHDESKRAMRELRALVRGIHPSVLSDRGLDAALSGLAERASMPVEIRGGAGGRLPAAVETAAYYVVAETLTNAGKHAEASRAGSCGSRRTARCCSAATATCATTSPCRRGR